MTWQGGPPQAMRGRSWAGTHQGKSTRSSTTWLPPVEAGDGVPVPPGWSGLRRCVCAGPCALIAANRVIDGYEPRTKAPTPRPASGSDRPTPPPVPVPTGQGSDQKQPTGCRSLWVKRLIAAGTTGRMIRHAGHSTARRPDLVRRRLDDHRIIVIHAGPGHPRLTGIPFAAAARRTHYFRQIRTPPSRPT